MASTEIRGQAGVSANIQKAADGFPVVARAFRDGTLAKMDWRMLKVMEGKVFQIQIGDEDSPVATTTSIADTLVFGVVDVPTGFIAIPIRAECHVATWTTATLVNAMLEVDNGKVRWSSGGTAFTPLNLHTGSSGASSCPAYVMEGAGIVTAAKTASGSIEVARMPIGEDAITTATGSEKCFIYDDVCPPYVVGPASILLHFGSATADVTGYGLLRWIELTV